MLPECHCFTCCCEVRKYFSRLSTIIRCPFHLGPGPNSDKVWQHNWLLTPLGTANLSWACAVEVIETVWDFPLNALQPV